MCALREPLGDFSRIEKYTFLLLLFIISVIIITVIFISAEKKKPNLFEISNVYFSKQAFGGHCLHFQVNNINIKTIAT